MAISVGWLILVPPFVSMYRTLRRIEAAQEINGTGEPINVWLGFTLYLVGVFTLPVEIIYAQSELNRLWRTGAQPAALAPASRLTQTARREAPASPTVARRTTDHGLSQSHPEGNP